MFPRIEIWYAHICPLCHKALDFFRSRCLAVTGHEIHWDPAANELVDFDLTRRMTKSVAAR